MNNNSNTLNINDKLDIPLVGFPKIPDDIIFPDELNRFLREQIQYYVHENGMLQKNFGDLELDCKEYRKKINDLETKLSKYEKLCGKNDFVTSAQVASSKIVDLSKKLREKNSEVESLKTKYSRLEAYVIELKQTLESQDEKVVEKEEKPANQLEEQVRKLSEKLSATTNKLSETKNTNLQLKNDLKMANKWLQQEIGEQFESIQSLSGSNGTWRGRAQIICDLQQKNNDLKEKLRAAQDKITNPVSETTLLASKLESRVSILSRENNDVKVKYDELKKKNEALRARCKVLDTDYNLLKSNFAIIKEQSERDRDLIATLSSQISHFRDTKMDAFHQKDRIIHKIESEKKSLLSEIEEYKYIINGLREEIDKRNKEFEDLKSKFSCGMLIGTESQTNTVDEKKNKFDSEKVKLLELIEEQNNRLKAERDAHTKTQSLLRIEKQKAAKAEATAARAELESNTFRSGNYSSTSLRPMDCKLRDQLELAEENIKALKTRLEIEQFERKTDLQEFAKILQNYENKI